jgi:hypothetical protein
VTDAERLEKIAGVYLIEDLSSDARLVLIAMILDADDEGHVEVPEWAHS